MASDQKCDDECDIVIIGAGFGGLSAAYKIQQLCISNNKPLPSITIIEADNRVGGRSSTKSHKGISLDLGAHWIGPQHTHIHKLLKDLSLSSKVYNQYNKGNKILDINNIQSLFRTEIPTPVGILSLIDTQIMISDIERMTKTVYSNDDNKTAKKYLDSISFLSLIKDLNVLSGSTMQLCILMIRMLVGCELSQVSALQFLCMVKQSGFSVDALGAVDGGYQQSVIHGGTQQIAQELKSKVIGQNDEKKCKILFNNSVFRVDQNENNNECFVYFAERNDEKMNNPTIKIEDISCCSRLNLKISKKIRAKYVISAVPLAVNGKYIEFNPKIDAKLNNLFSRSQLGTYWKGFGFFDECFWKKYGFSGELMTDGKNGPILVGMDKDTSHINVDKAALNKHWNGQKIYCLFGMSGGDIAKKWNKMTKIQRQNAFIDQLSAYFNKLIPSKERNECDLVRKHFVEYVDVCWDECGPFDVFSAGTGFDRFEIATKGQKDFVFENVHFVSTNFGSNCCGYLEGAISSGYDQAQIVFDRMYKNEKIATENDDADIVESAFEYRSIKSIIKMTSFITVAALSTAYALYKYRKKRK